MNIKTIKKLALESYTNNKLDKKRVDKIVKYLGRADLKLYIKAIKNYENKKTVTVISPANIVNGEIIKEIGKLFPNKEIIVKKDEKLIAGIRIVDNDTIYDFNLQNTLDNLVSHINQ